MGHKRFAQYRNRLKNSFVALLFLGTQFVAPLAVVSQASAAAAKITAKSHMGQLAPSGSYSSGNITTYSEGQSINFQFDLTGDASTSGQLEVRFTGNDGTCLFFNGDFHLGTHDNSANAIVPVTGGLPTVTPVGSPVATAFGTSSGEWVQTLNINFASAGEAIVNYYLTLSDHAGECNGSSQHSRLNPAGGDITQTGQQNVPVPANQIIELPEITVQKNVDTNGDGVSDRTALAGEWSFSLDGGTPVATDANGRVVFNDVTPDGNHTVTESSGPSGQSFISGSGTNCTFTGSTATANIKAGTTAQGATCTFLNGVAPGSITIVKDAIPNSAQDFAFTATGTGVSNFSLDDDSDSTLSNTKTFTGLTTGNYIFAETAVSGWDFDKIVCSDGSSVTKTGASVTVALTAGQNVTCTYTNRQRGQIVVHKVTNPANDSTPFSITASGTTSITGATAVTAPATRTVTTSSAVTYSVAQLGTYSVSEDLTNTPGWTQASNTCSNLTMDGNTPLVNGVPTLSCTITNTKLARLKIVKDAVPNDAQDFGFTTSGSGLSPFSLDDDSDNTLPNSQQFLNLAPGSYSVTEGAISGWKLTQLTCNDGSFDWSGADTTATVSLAAGADVTCTFTNTKLGMISGTKYEVNAGATTGTGAVGQSGWTINLFTNGQLVTSTQTDANGHFSFTDLMPNAIYSLTETLINGWTQIFHPGDVNLAAGQNSTGNDFGNFKNGSINGVKFNDHNGNGVKDSSDENLSGWTINLENSSNVVLDHKDTSTTGYSFTNLAPGTYKVCEVAQTGWAQTLPGNNGCYTTVIDQSGETDTDNFGNQGRGTIKVVKNVDTDGNGSVDQTNVTDWTWNIDGSGGYATGSTQNVAAGTYTVGEVQKTDYHVTASSCTGETAPNSPTESLSATVSAGENVVCTFTNTRDTGGLKLIKHVVNDNGGKATADQFNLHVKQSGSDVVGSPAAGSETGTSYTLLTGSYTVSEDTPLSGYTQTSIVCDGQATATVSVTSGQSKSCTITNDDVAPKLTLVKMVTNDNGGKAIATDFTLSATRSDTNAVILSGAGGASGNVQANLGYNLSETNLTGYTPSSWFCGVGGTLVGSTVTLVSGADVTCTITNDDVAPLITVTKNVVNNNGGQLQVSDFPLFVGNLQVVSGVQTAVNAGTYQVSETGNSGYQASVWTGDCTSLGNVTLEVGHVYACSITNDDIPAHITVTKVVTNDNGGKAVPGDFALYVGNTQVVSGVTNSFNANQSYTVSEKNGPSGYTQTSLTCEDSDTHASLGATFTPKLNENVTCEIDNDDIAPTLTLVKHVTNDNGGKATTANFQGKVDGTNVSWGAPVTLNAGTYTASEAVLTGGEGYQASAWSNACADNGTVTLTVGQNLTCEITNDDIASQLTVIKHVINDNTNRTNTAGDFTMNVDGTNVSDSSFPGDENGTAVTLDQGSYNVTEDSNSDYSVSYSADCDSSIKVGESKTCTVTNTAILKPSIHVEKDGPATAYEGDTVTYTFTVTNTGNTPLSIDKVNDNVVGDGVYQSGDANSNDMLDVTETWVYTKSFTVPAGSGDIHNTVTVCGVDVAQDEACDTDYHRTHVYHPMVNVTKYVYTSQASDDGTFNLQIDSTTKAIGGDGTTTGDVLVTPGDHTVGETGASGTDLSDYDTDIECWIDGDYIGTQTDPTLHNVNVTGDEHANCDIYNTRHAHLTVVKDAVPNDPQKFDFTLEQYNSCEEVEVSTFTNGSLLNQECNSYSTLDSFQLQDNTDPTKSTHTNSLSADWYRVSEADTVNWDLTNLDCGDVEVAIDGNMVEVYLQPGQDVTCTFTNTRQTGTVTVKKQLSPTTDPGKFNLQINGKSYADNVGDGGTTDAVKLFSDETYTIGETAGTGTSLGDYNSAYICLDDSGAIVVSGQATSSTPFKLSKDENVICTLYNNRKPGEVLGISTVAPVLVNTGQNSLVAMIVGLSLMLTAMLTLLFTGQRKQTA